MWKNILSENSAVHFHECKCYMLSQVEVQSNGCCWGVFFGTRAWGSKASYSSCWPLCHNLALYHPVDERAAPLVTLWIFMGLWFLLAKKQRAEEWPVCQGCCVCSMVLAWCLKSIIFLNLTPLMFSVGDPPWQFWSSIMQYINDYLYWGIHSFNISHNALPYLFCRMQNVGFNSCHCNQEMLPTLEQ